MVPASSIRLLLADDHAVVRMGLSAVLGLEQDFRVVAEVDDGEQALSAFRASRPDVALLDVQMPRKGGIQALREILSESPDAKVIMLTTSDLDQDAVSAMKAGASAYLLKSVSRGELVRAIREVYSGKRYMPSSLRKRLEDSARCEEGEARGFRCSDGVPASPQHEEERQRLKRLVSVLCHDVSNPLMVVQLSHSLMKRQLGSGAQPAALAASLRRAEEGSAAIAGLLEDVRTLEALRSSEGILPMEEVDVAVLARRALAMFQERAAVKRVVIRDGLPDTALGYAVSGILVRSVFANLLSNAVKFSHFGGAIEVDLVREPGRLGVRICDSGSGVPEGVITALAGLGKIESRCGTAGERGTGLGLMLARDFICAVGGSLQIAPRSEHGAAGAQGTSAIVWLREA